VSYEWMILMIKFVIVEDNIDFQKKITNIIDKLVFKTDYEYEIEKHEKYNIGLCRTIKDASPKKIYILDIALNGNESGLDIAQEIRRTDWDSEIIFVTNHDRMFETAHRTILKIFDFIEKFHELESRLEKNLNLILSKKADYAKFCFENNKIKIQVFLKDIAYIHRDTHERKSIIHTTNNRFIVNMALVDIMAKLDERFKQVHRACIVNTDRVQIYDWCEGFFVLDTKEKVELCSKKFKENMND
jgi:two-component system response regulator AgrA